MAKLVILFDLHMFEHTCTAIPLKGLNVTWKICDRGTCWQNRVTVCKQHCYTTCNKDLSTVHVPKRFLHSDSKLAIMPIMRLKSITRAEKMRAYGKRINIPSFFVVNKRFTYYKWWRLYGDKSSADREIYYTISILLTLWY